MNSVEPIRDYDLILDFMDYLKTHNERDYVMFCTCIYAPLRITDILPWKVRDVKDKKYISLTEKKTDKKQLFPINDELKKVLDEYIENKKDYEYLFPSRQKNKDGIYSHITRQQAYNILNNAAKAFGIERIGCHSTRKTFGYHYYQQTKDIATLQEIFGHDHPSITLRYIGINQEMKDKVIKGFKYKKIGNEF